MTDSKHQKLVESLQSKSHKSISIKRYDDVCYLVIELEDESHVFVDRLGKRKTYRHAWQAKEWLKSTFGINPGEVEVEKVR